jgi:hypothetical protein
MTMEGMGWDTDTDTDTDTPLLVVAGDEEARGGEPLIPRVPDGHLGQVG